MPQLFSNYDLVKVNLVRAGCPLKLQSTRENGSVVLPIVIEHNREEHGLIEATGYYPPAVVVSGNARRLRLLENQLVASWAFVEKEALPVNKDGAMPASEFLTRLQQALEARAFPSGINQINPIAWPNVVGCFPFSNTMLYSQSGKQFSQHFSLDPTERRIRLEGSGIPVIINAGMGPMPRADNGFQYSPASVSSMDYPNNRGASRSELMTELVRDLSNITEAINRYLAAIKNGLYKQMRPMFYPVQLNDNGKSKIAQSLTAAGIALVDFCRWASDAKMTKAARVMGSV